VAIKNILGGFMVAFPIMTMIAAYEARYSMWAICRQVPVTMMTVIPMLATIRLTQKQLGLGSSLLLGWLVLLAILIPLTLLMWSREGKRLLRT
jgi:hypothetical protein